MKNTGRSTEACTALGPGRRNEAKLKAKFCVGVLQFTWFGRGCKELGDPYCWTDGKKTIYSEAKQHNIL